MFQGLIAFWHSLASFLTVESIFYALASSLVGVVIGALPGLTATMGVALMTTLTIKLPPAQALLILICTYVGAIYGGSRSAILLNIPGTPASAASCLDGYALARQGHAGRAMGLEATQRVWSRCCVPDWHAISAVADRTLGSRPHRPRNDLADASRSFRGLLRRTASARGVLGSRDRQERRPGC